MKHHTTHRPSGRGVQALALFAALTLGFASAQGCIDAGAPGEDDPSAGALGGLEGPAGGGIEPVDPPCPPEPACDPTIDENDFRVSPSLVITRNTQSIPGLPDAPVLDAHFSLQNVVAQLLSLSGASTSETPEEWFRRFWETHNESGAPPFEEPFQPHCDDNGSTINGFPLDCPRVEGQHATNGAIGNFQPIAVFNRFDLAPTDGSHCGEYRIVYAHTGGGRNFMIFEAQLPNPNPACGVNACRPVVNFWKSLSNVTSQKTLGNQLQGFYFNGLPGFSPVVTPQNYGLGAGGGSYGASGGQIRTNEFEEFNWQLREFKLAFACDETSKVGACRLFAQPVTVKNNPFFDLFDIGSTLTRAPAFQSSFTASPSGDSQVSLLAASHPNPVTALNLIAMDISDKFNAAQSTSMNTSEDYTLAFASGANPFRTAIEDELTAIGSPLTANEVIFRAETQSCAGCHQISNGDPLGSGLQWPNSNGFTHVNENGARSQALRCVFLPHRQAVGIGFLQNCGSNPPPIVPGDPDCAGFVSTPDGFAGPKAPGTSAEEQAAKDADAPSTVKTMGGGSKVN